MTTDWHQEAYPISKIPADLVVNRRRFIRMAGAAGLALAAAGSITSCEAAAFNPAAADWLSQLALAVGAAEVEKVIEGGLDDAWRAWQDGVKEAATSQPSPYIHCCSTGWVHPVPPVVMVGLSKSMQVDPTTDHLIACVHKGRSAIVFKPWAWQTLSMLAHSLTSGKTGNDLTQARALCALTVVPAGVRHQSGQSPAGIVDWLTYQSRNGYVEIARSPGPGDSWNGSITVSAISDAYGNPLTQVFSLPTSAG
jgi:hypothetical protein